MKLAEFLNALLEQIRLGKCYQIHLNSGKLHGSSN